jgi:hypothetical protein
MKDQQTSNDSFATSTTFRWRSTWAPRFTTVQRKVDRLLTTHWWWRRRLKLAEQHLENMLEEFGEHSVQARRATVQYRRVNFAYIYGRPAKPDVQAKTKYARETTDVPLLALWILIINRDIRKTKDGIRVRRAWWARPAKYIARGLVFLSVMYLGTYTLAHPGPIGLKLAICGVIALIHVPIYYVWDLYTARPLAVIRQYGDVLDRAFDQLNGCRVINFPENDQAGK